MHNFWFYSRFWDEVEDIGVYAHGATTRVRQRTHASKFRVRVHTGSVRACVRQIGKTRENGGLFSSFSSV